MKYRFFYNSISSEGNDFSKENMKKTPNDDARSKDPKMTNI